jgi:hypothetical protein
MTVKKKVPPVAKPEELRFESGELRLRGKAAVKILMARTSNW